MGKEKDIGECGGGEEADGGIGEWGRGDAMGNRVEGWREG
jgi:hypothetical protein